MSVFFVLTLLKLFPYVAMTVYAFHKNRLRFCIAAMLGTVTTLAQLPPFQMDSDLLTALRLIFAVFLLWHITEVPAFKPKQRR